MTYGEHLAWCKERALEYCRAGKVQEAYSSFMSDMKKHPETSDHPVLALGFSLLVNGHLRSVREMKEFILGFN